ncbi:dihydroxyacetone kinase subunit L [Proteiniclasticum sp. BAD-10]|jgi:dihydroxyacetone kinase-like protein|uniref:phosphoenolpyruvate--glycerone phosphotransferase n=1 Tax=Proteiniclasticum sediminis TaxID=2804028 RepID=A0A941CRW5_9CLOT|nr:dihydroxyacetone kinase subunit DhaL [Proteiniclasticum sediminis]MBR0576484.1 dihydroxyacetone kinase subunit L [Proteiniclasticum sediminis]
MANKDKVFDVIMAISDIIEEKKLYLTQLDAAIGDGDHGLNMAKGFGAAREKLESGSFQTPSDILKAVGMALISKVGGAAGPLYGTAFLNASKVVAGKEEIGLADFTAMLESALDGVKSRGKAVRGEKTMVDALEPALDALKAALDEGTAPEEALNRAVKAAEEGVAFTKTIRATKGRASYLGDRSIGHEDPGAMSSYVILKTIAETCSR